MRIRFIPRILICCCSIISACSGGGGSRVEKTEEQERMDNIAGRIEYEFNMVKDPATGKIPLGIYEAEMAQARQNFSRQQAGARTLATTYTFQGPENLGGRTRSVAYDIRYNGTTNQIMLAGGVSGGVFKSINNGTSWVRKSPAGQHFSCTSIAQDPRPGSQDTWYYTTGENSGNSASATGAGYSGNGVYKSTDNGETWVRLPNSNNTPLESFSTNADFISRVIVHPVTGDVYIAATASIIRSQDGGGTWATVQSGSLANGGQLTDIIVSSTGVLYSAFGGSNSSTIDGVWTSTTGNAGAWTRLAGTGVATNPTGWNAQGTYGRVVLALAPSNQNLLFVLYNNNMANPAIEADFYKYDVGTAVWADLSANLPDEPGNLSGNDPFAIQGGYDLVVAVKPDDENAVFVGGTNIYRSTDGFTTNTATTRMGGYNSPASYAQYPNSHPDIHGIVFQPGSPTVMVCTNDGGIQRTNNNLAASISWTTLNTGYRTYQYYYVAQDPRAGNTKVIGGAQDNGSTRNIGGAGSNFELAFGGDGVSVGLSNPIGGNIYEYVGSQSGNIARRLSTFSLGGSNNIRPNTATGGGLFVTLFHLDPDNTETLYYANSTSLYRNTSASTANSTNWTLMSGVGTAINATLTAFASTRGAYNPATASLFIGTNTSRIFRLDDPANALATDGAVNISSGLPASGYISSICVNPNNDDTVMVTLSNYGAISIFWTGNANAAVPTWTNVERNVTLPSVRSSAIGMVGSTVTYFMGTSTGLYTTDNPLTTDWTQEAASTLGNAVISHLSYRPADRRLLVGTHGYGMWSATLSQFPAPVGLENFKVSLDNQSGLLQWTTSFEQNSNSFVIEKSTDGNRFYTIGTVAATGNSTVRKVYNFRDAQLGQWNYYRLQQFDIDGKSKTSTVLLLQNAGAKQNIWVVNNPFTDYIDLRTAAPVGRVKLQLYRADGSLVAENVFTNPSSVLRWTMQTNLNNGAYILRATVDGKTFTHKLIRQ